MKTKHLLHLPGLRFPNAKRILGCLGLTLAVVSVQAATIVMDDTFPGMPIATDFSLDFPQFDPSLGTLNSAEVQIYSTINLGTIGIYNANEYDVPVILTLQAGFSLQVVGESTTIPTISFNVGATNVGTASPGEGYFPTLTAQGGFVGTTFTSPGDLGLFTGPGNVATRANAGDDIEYQQQGFSNMNYLSGGGNTGRRIVTYDYTPVGAPEPSSWLLTVVCGVALLGLRRRTRLS